MVPDAKEGDAVSGGEGRSAGLGHEAQPTASERGAEPFAARFVARYRRATVAASATYGSLAGGEGMRVLERAYTLVTGPAGGGKTTLIERLVASNRSR